MKALLQKIANTTKNIAVKTATVCKKTAINCVKCLKGLSRKNKIAIALSLVVVLSSTAFSATLAKYSQVGSSDTAVTAKSFYFESNLLKNSNEVYYVYADSISFDLMNYPDMERTSQVDIRYNVTISSSDGGALGSGTNTSGYLYCKTNNNDENYTPAKATVTYTGLTQGKNYTITATATETYSKAISAQFYIVPGNYNLTSTVKDKADYVLLTFSTLDYMGNVKITWQSGYVPDNSEPIMNSAVGSPYITSVTNNTTYTIKFYKTGNEQFNASAFSVATSA